MIIHCFSDWLAALFQEAYLGGINQNNVRVE